MYTLKMKKKKEVNIGRKVLRNCKWHEDSWKEIAYNLPHKIVGRGSLIGLKCHLEYFLPELISW